jgi:hypothetical protein
MSVVDLKEALADVPGINSLTMQNLAGMNRYCFDGIIVSLPPDANQPEIAAAIRKAARLPGISPIFEQLRPRTETKMATTGAKFLADLIRTRQAKVKDQLAQAGNELNAVMDEMEATADAATKQVADAKAEVADLKAALGLNSNGGE